jgi:hypothetical protein
MDDVEQRPQAADGSTQALKMEKQCHTGLLGDIRGKAKTYE